MTYSSNCGNVDLKFLATTLTNKSKLRVNLTPRKDVNFYWANVRAA